MVRKHILLTIVLALTLCTMSAAFAAVNAVTPSTNVINKTYTPDKWAHVNDAPGVGTVTLEFVSERGFASCFEYLYLQFFLTPLQESGKRNSSR